MGLLSQLGLQTFGLRPLKILDSPFRREPLDLQPLSLLRPPQGLLDLPPFGLLSRPLQRLRCHPDPHLRLLPPPSLPLQGLFCHLLPGPRLSLDYPPPLCLGLERPPKLHRRCRPPQFASLGRDIVAVAGIPLHPDPTDKTTLLPTAIQCPNMRGHNSVCHISNILCLRPLPFPYSRISGTVLIIPAPFTTVCLHYPVYLPCL